MADSVNFMRLFTASLIFLVVQSRLLADRIAIEFIWL